MWSKGRPSPVVSSHSTLIASSSSALPARRRPVFFNGESAPATSVRRTLAITTCYCVHRAALSSATQCDLLTADSGCPLHLYAGKNSILSTHYSASYGQKIKHLCSYSSSCC